MGLRYVLFVWESNMQPISFKLICRESRTSMVGTSLANFPALEDTDTITLTLILRSRDTRDSADDFGDWKKFVGRRELSQPHAT